MLLFLSVSLDGNGFSTFHIWWLLWLKFILGERDMIKINSLHERIIGREKERVIKGGGVYDWKVENADGLTPFCWVVRELRSPFLFSLQCTIKVYQLHIHCLLALMFYYCLRYLKRYFWLFFLAFWTGFGEHFWPIWLFKCWEQIMLESCEQFML